MGRFAAACYPQARVVHLKLWQARLLAKVIRNGELAEVTELIAYLDSAGEHGGPALANELYGAPVITLDDWCEMPRDEQGGFAHWVERQAMTTMRQTAAAVGVLFIVATGFVITGQLLHAPLLGEADALELAFPHRARVVAGVLTEFVGVMAIPLIALVFYPILRRHAEASALSYIGLRLLEAVALLIVDANLWSIVTLSEAYHSGRRRPPSWSRICACSRRSTNRRS